MNTDPNSPGSASSFNPSSFPGTFPSPTQSAQEELQALQKKYDALRIQFDGLNRLLEAQSKEFQATLQERDSILDASKAASARILELELRIQTLMREYRSTEQLYKTVADLNQQLDTLTERLINEQEARKQTELALIQASDRLRRFQQPPPAPAVPAEASANPAPNGTKGSNGAHGLAVSAPTGALLGTLARPGSGAVSKALSKTIAALTSLMPKLEKGTTDAKLLGELALHCRSVNEEAAQMGVLPFLQLITATRLLVEDVNKNPALMVPSRFRSLKMAVELIALLCQKENQNKLKALLPPNVLAVDDDGGVLEVLAGQLGELGMGVTSTQDPNLGLSVLQNQRFNLIFLDIGMSEHNGLELCARIRKMEDYGQTPIIFLTGLVSTALRDQAIAIGGDDFIGKPFHTTELGLKAVFWAIRGQI